MHELGVRGISPTRSFFPLAMNGISEPMEMGAAARSKRRPDLKFRFVDFRDETNSKRVKAALSSLEAAIVKIGSKVIPIKGMPYEQEAANSDSDRKEFTVDIGFVATDIFPSDPDSDIRLMFSKQGINIPDTDGSIQRELRNEEVSAQTVNEKLHEQAVVWPITHFSKGIWARKFLDTSRYGFLYPLGELQWIGSK